ncbi:beta-N-acetylhexosaminidase [Paenibacillus prosopidis]|uniref:beta-N-acetylhexosaminidase n=1 Tax=Paenibacillus prosopidis TaxID=630520 RepID=A0A368W5J9_9BACL|nr:beta-N-acetylhexosaminidase [Paenibacillus prosopidis]RCW50374.1 beta-N-acetylhexosaminidase [Paenibacillus prosopidis]
MYKKIALLLSHSLIFSLLVCCGTSTANKPNEAIDPIKEKIAGMTIDEKIGQMVIVGLKGTSIQARALKMIESYHIGGFILYKENIADANQTMTLLNQLKAANISNTAPLWLSVDQEGGKVSRMPDEFIELPKAQQVGMVNQRSYTRQIGLALGKEVHSLGFNMDFAPVLDINSNPNNPVIGDRSFGSDPQTVVRHGIETMKAIQSEQVAAVVKHFPGHGDTSVDSHLDLPVVYKTLKELQSFELLPFEEAIKQGADAIMIAHLLIPNIDKQNPASLSRTIITNLLRENLKFDGVVITDDMTMGGIIKHYDIGEAAIKSVQAGSDILLVGHDYDKQVSVLQALKKSTDNGILTEETLDRSVYRILRLKAKYNLKDDPVISIDVDKVNRKIEAALEASLPLLPEIIDRRI